MEDLLGLTNPAPLSLQSLAINMLLGVVLSSLLAWFYARYGRSFSNRARFSQNLPPLALVTILIISVVKSSLALSLGLVGALSIVRFRTAIKEPEELVYLFLSIAVGLGLGADQRLPTILAVAIILAFFGVQRVTSNRVPRNNLYFHVNAGSAETTFTTINQLLLNHIQSADIRRLDSVQGRVQITYLIAPPDETTLIALMDSLKNELPEAEFSFVEQQDI